VTTIAPARPHERDELAPAIAGAFGANADLARRYAELLTTDGIERGTIGPREADRIWSRHLLNCVALSGLVERGSRVIDLGSGAGLPGIPLAIARPDLTVVLVEPMLRRVEFLRDCLAALGLTGVEVRHQRAQDGVEPLADYVVVRAVASLPRLVDLSFDLLVDNGELLALKGRSAAAEVDQVQRECGLTPEVLTVTGYGQPATVVRVSRPSRVGRSGKTRSVTGRRPRTRR
jgi:16S rRNA (guanine527-N7)-methyltransferase